ncbi:MAG: hypothetical protein IT370_32565 [Deltaproteobacteria bacterium]|nr:hypothetical protein [Deltaproteobacteria bacterium]
MEHMKSVACKRPHDLALGVPSWLGELADVEHRVLALDALLTRRTALAMEADRDPAGRDLLAAADETLLAVAAGRGDGHSVHQRIRRALRGYQRALDRAAFAAAARAPARATPASPPPRRGSRVR